MTQDRSARFAFVRASWHADIVDRAYDGFTEVIDAAQVDSFAVPGAFELPLMAQRLAKTGRYDAVICAAFVVDGGIYRHDFVAQTVVDGLMRVGLDCDLPVLSVSLTPHHFQPTPDHIGFFENHFRIKGMEAAETALSVARAAMPIRAMGLVRS